MGKADLHLHTCHSDGQPTVRELMDHIRDNTDLDVIAITDHDTIAGAVEARRMAADYPFEVIVAEEVTSIDGHIVGLFLEERVPPGMSVEATVREIHLQGGLAFAPHPFFRNGFFTNKGHSMLGLGERLVDACMDGIEVINSTPALRWANDRARTFANNIGCLSQLANSDAHIRQAAGKSYTLFPGGTAEHLRQAISGGSTQPAAARYALSELLTYLDFWLRNMKMGVPASRLYGVGSATPEYDLLDRA
jgi:predicted metal-dependent phosphoesterase TrpH